MEKVRIAQIGISRYAHSKSIFESLTRQPEVFDIAGYVLVEDEERLFADMLGVFDGYPRLTLEEVLNDPAITAVTVETEEIHLTRYALLAVQHGKHVHMEKPGGTSAEEFDRLIDAVEEHKKVFHTGYMYRYNPYVADLLRQVKNGELGEIVSVDAQMDCYEPDALHRWLSGIRGGMMFYLGCHLIDLMLLLQGEPEKITCYNRSTGRNGVPCTDFAMAVFEYPHGVSCIRTAGSQVGGFGRRQLVVAGTKKTVEIKPLEQYDDWKLYTQKTEYAVMHDWSDKGITDRTDYYDRYDEMMRSFARMVAGEADNPYTPEHERAVHRLLMRCCEG